jgi:cytochrome c
MRWFGLALLLVAPAMAGGIAWAQTIGDPVAGRRLAEAWCSECHAITVYTAGTPRRGPDFAEIARRSKTTALSLNVFLRSSHDTMPNLILKQDEADDIVSYVLSLKGE